MTKKRRSTVDDDHAQIKRNRKDDGQRGDEHAAAVVQAQVDPTYGQRGAFPGVDDQDNGSELFYGPASDGLEYIRMVRYGTD